MGDGFPSLGDRERLTVVLGAMVVLLLAALDQSIVAPALPTIGAALGDVEYLSWVVSAYFLTSTAVTPLYGKLADLKGRKATLHTAIAVFTVGSVLCAAAPNMTLLVIGRAVQGLGGGGLISLVQTVIGDVVPPRERGRYMGWISLVWATASVSGPVVGGVFAQHLHWSLIFWINLPLAVVAMVMIARAMRHLPDVSRPQRLDLLGAALIVGGTVALMLALTWGGSRMPWTSPQVLGLFAVAAIAFAAFGRHVARVEDALIPLTVLRNPVVAVTTSAMFFVMGSWLSLSVYVPIWLAQVHGFGAANAGFGLIGLTLGTVLGANAGGRMLARVVHYKRLALAGAALGVVANAGLALGAAALPFWAAELLLVAAGLGTGALFPLSTVVVQNAVDRRDLGVATATHAFFRALGTVVIVAILGAIFLASGLGEAIEGGVAHKGLSPEEVALAGSTFRLIFATATLGQAMGLVIFFFLEERPLIGRGAPARGSGEAS
jgi:MFS family permease